MPENDSIPPAGFRQIQNFPRYAIDENGTILSVCRRGSGAHRNLPWSLARRLKNVVNSDGYHSVDLCRDGNIHRVVVHSLVLTTFVGPRPDGLECRHIDGNKLNNRLSNLAYGTSRENKQDKIRHGTSGKGEMNGMAKLTKDDVLEIRRRRASGETLNVIADEFHVSEASIRDVICGRTWKHI